MWGYHEAAALISAQVTTSCMNVDLFNAQVLAPLVSYIERHGGRSEALLDRARIPGELIAAGGWVTKKQAYDFTLDVAQYSRHPSAVFRAYLGFEFDDLGFVAAAMRRCKTVKEALEVGARVGGAAYEGNDYFLQTDGDTTWFCYREPTRVSAGQTYVNDMTLTVMYQLIRAAAGGHWRPERMLVWQDSMDRHRTVPGFEDCQAFAHPHYTALAFPTRFLHRRSPWQRRGSELGTLTVCHGPPGSPAIVDALYRLVASRLSARKLPTLEQVAVMVGASPATLKRSLHAVGTNYHYLLDRVRFDAACSMLAVPQMTIGEIASELGYSGTNNFVRSFHRLTGMTPGKFRRQPEGQPLEAS